MGSITSANSVLTLSQVTLFPAPVQLQGFANDDIYDFGEINIAETSMGVDGILSAGFVWSEVPQTVALQADSASNDFFDTIATQSLAAQDVYPLTGTLILPAIGLKLRLVNGTFKTWKPAPDGKRTFQPRRFGIRWNKVFPVAA